MPEWLGLGVFWLETNGNLERSPSLFWDILWIKSISLWQPYINVNWWMYKLFANSPGKGQKQAATNNSWTPDKLEQSVSWLMNYLKIWHISKHKSNPSWFTLTHLSPYVQECQRPSCHRCVLSPSGPGLHVFSVPERCGSVSAWKCSHQWKRHGPAPPCLRIEALPKLSKPPTRSQAPTEATGSALHCYGLQVHRCHGPGKGPCIWQQHLIGHRARRRKQEGGGEGRWILIGFGERQVCVKVTLRAMHRRRSLYMMWCDLLQRMEHNNKLCYYWSSGLWNSLQWLVQTWLQSWRGWNKRQELQLHLHKIRTCVFGFTEDFTMIVPVRTYVTYLQF